MAKILMLKTQQKIKNKKVLNFGHLNLEFVWDLEFGAWNLKAGFTLLELLVVIAVFALIAGAVGLSLSSFLEGRTRETYAADLRQTLRQAQSYSMANYKQSAWGVYLDQNQNRFIRFKGMSYAARDTSFDRETRLPSSLRFGTVELRAGASEMVFTSTRGETAQAGLIELQQGEAVSQLQINSYGQIELSN